MQCSCYGAPVDPSNDTAFDNSADNGGTSEVRIKVQETANASFYKDEKFEDDSK
jgi:hypothetical protein